MHIFDHAIDSGEQIPLRAAVVHNGYVVADADHNIGMLDGGDLAQPFDQWKFAQVFDAH
jgi:hypothetical protein